MWGQQAARKTRAREHLPWALRIAAFPRPAPEPWFLFFMLFSMGAFFSMSGRIRKRILLPRMYTCSSWATRPSRYVTVMLDICKRTRAQPASQPTPAIALIGESQQFPGLQPPSVTPRAPGLTPPAP